MSAKLQNKFFRFIKTWAFVVMLVSFVSALYARYTHSTWMEYGALAVITSLLYLSLVLVEFVNKNDGKPLFKIVTDLGDD